MRRDGLTTAILVVGALLALTYAVLGVIVAAGDEWDSNGERVLWLVFTVGAAALMAFGLTRLRTRRGLAAVLIAIGALMGGFATFWSIVVPVTAIALVVLLVVWSRRDAAPAASA